MLRRYLHSNSSHRPLGPQSRFPGWNPLTPHYQHVDCKHTAPERECNATATGGGGTRTILTSLIISSLQSRLARPGGRAIMADSGAPSTKREISYHQIPSWCKQKPY